MVGPIQRFITDFGQPQELRQVSDGVPWEEAPVAMVLPRYGVWEQGGQHRRAEVIETGDDLAALCAKYGVDPASVIAIGRR